MTGGLGQGQRPVPSGRVGLAAAGLTRLLGGLLQVLGVEGVEVDGLEHDLREAALGDQVRDDLAGIGEELIRAVGGEQRPQFLLGKALGGEEAGLVDLDDQGRLVLDLGRDRDRQHHLIGIVADGVDLGVDVEFVLGLPVGAEDVRCTGGLEGQILGVDALDGELTVVLGLGLVGHGDGISVAGFGIGWAAASRASCASGAGWRSARRAPHRSGCRPRRSPPCEASDRPWRTGPRSGR